MPVKIAPLIFFLTCSIISAQITDSLKNDSAIEMLTDAPSILERYIDSVGGREQLSNLVDKRTMLAGLAGVTELNIEIIQKAPNKVYQSLTAGPMSQETWFDGENGRQEAMGREQIFEGIFLESIRIQSAMNLEMNYLNYGVTPLYSGVDTVEEKEAYKITWELPSGIDWIYYYSVETGFLVKQVITHDTGQGKFSQTNFLYDYKEVDGIKFPHRFTQISGGQVFELEVQLLEINRGVDDSEFE
jgi:hypothetical protein